MIVAAYLVAVLALGCAIGQRLRDVRAADDALDARLDEALQGIREAER